MFDSKTTISISGLQKRWQWQKALLFYTKLLAYSILLFSILSSFFGASFFWLLLFMIIASLLVYVLPRFWKLSEKDVAFYLNAQYPALEESAELMLLPYDQANRLQQIQINKIQSVLESLLITNPLKKQFKRTLILIFASLLMGCSFWMFLGFQEKKSSGIQNDRSDKKEIRLPGILNVQVHIVPPKYTGKNERTQNNFSIIAEDGSSVEWILETDHSNIPPSIILNDSVSYKFESINSNQTKWRFTHRLTKNGLYQIQWNSQLSTHYQLEVINDLVPVINIQQPKQYTVVDYGMPLQIPLQVSVKDDYGIVSSKLILTIASGGGESVKFKEQEVPFVTQNTAHQLELLIKQNINLQLLKMIPGDELYFYVKASDNHQQESRTDIHIISLADTAELMQLDVTINSLSLKPEFFRSQRQIIIETEQLLRDKDKISTTAFNEKSNELGIDQKLLRLRYGKFLGEESEANIGDSRFDQDEDHNNEQGVFGEATSIIDAFSHKHDNAEDASFFDPQTKKELKAVLTEMWGSELQLRTFMPKDALPFEYKALRLLKELQQQSRAYVAKTNQKTTPLKFEKRLTGDLSKIITPTLLQEGVKGENQTIILRKSVGIIVGLNSNETLNIEGLAILKKVLYQLNREAIAKPSMYLLPFEAMRRMIQAIEVPIPFEWHDHDLVLQALEKLLSTPNSLPGKHHVSADGGLSDIYFHHLNSSQK